MEMNSMHTVGLKRIDNYDEGKVRDALSALLCDIGFVLPKNTRVFIKPNCMAQNRPGQHTVTHHAIVAALAGLLKDNGCSILICESSAFFQTGLTRQAFVTTGMSEVAARYGARLVALEEERQVKIDLSQFADLRPDFPVRSLYLPGIILDAGVMINACKLKSHGNGFRFSGAIKNLYGLLPGGFKQKVHLLLEDDKDACDLMVALHKIVPQSLNVMDAIYGLDGGPSAIGKPVFVGALLASGDAFALDSVACGMVGYTPDEVPLLVRAKALGMIGDFDDVQVRGGPRPFVQFRRLHRGPFPGARRKDGIFIKDTYVRPMVVKRKCTDCKECVVFCPAAAISRKAASAYDIDYRNCAFCYYCFTACKAAAIGYRSTFTNKVIRFLWKVTGL